MGLVYSPTFGWFCMVNVGKHTIPMDAMGGCDLHIWSTPGQLAGVAISSPYFLGEKSTYTVVKVDGVRHSQKVAIC